MISRKDVSISNKRKKYLLAGYCCYSSNCATLLWARNGTNTIDVYISKLDPDSVPPTKHAPTSEPVPTDTPNMY